MARYGLLIQNNAIWNGDTLLFDTDVFNLIGEKIISVSNRNKINVSNLQNGIYFIRVNNVKKTYVQRFVKK